MATSLSNAVGSEVFYAQIVHWLLMITAMMLPLLIVPIRQVAFRSYCWRRGKAIAGFLVGYTSGLDNHGPIFGRGFWGFLLLWI